MANIGEKIRKVRKDAGLSQVDFAASIHVTQGFLSGLEKGRYQPTIDIIIGIANIYKVDVAWLLTGKGTDLSVTEAGPVWLRSIRPEEKLKLKLVRILVRIVDERDPRKLKAIEAQLELLDPGEK